MSLADAAATLSQAIDDEGALLVAPDLVAGCGDVLASLGLGHLRLDGAVVSERKRRPPGGDEPTLFRVDVSGSAEVLGLPRVQVDLRVKGPFAETVSLTVSSPGPWNFGTSFPGLPPSFKEDPAHPGMASLQPSLLYDFTFTDLTFVVRNGKTAGRDRVITFRGQCALPARYAHLGSLVGLTDVTTLSGIIELEDGSPPTVDLGLTIPATAIEVGALTVQDVSLHVRAAEAAPHSPALTSLECEGTIAVGSTDPVTLRVWSDYTSDGGVFSFQGQPVGREATLARALAAIAELAGGKPEDFALPVEATGVYLLEVAAEIDTRAQEVRQIDASVGSNAPWPVVPGMAQLDDLSLHWQVLHPFSAARTLSGAVAGTLAFGTPPRVHFDASAARSGDFTVEGRLRDGESVDLAQLIRLALEFEADMPELRVDALEIEVETAGDVHLAGSVTTGWAVEIDHRVLMLEEVSFSIDRSGDDRTATVHGQVDVAGARLYLQATLTAEAGGTAAAVFEGGTLPTGQPIRLTAVAEWLAELVGATLPASVPDIALTNLRMAFDTATKQIDVSGDTHTEIEVPFLGGDAAKVHTSVALSSSIDTATGKRRVAGVMEGDLTIGPSVFRLEYELGKDEHLFSASWDGTGGSDRLGLDTLLEALGMSGPVVPAEVDLNLQKVHLEYRVETKALQLVAESASYGTAFLIADRTEADASWAFVAGIEYSGAAGLADIPVLGAALAAAGLTFEQFGIVLSSAGATTFTIPQLPPLDAGPAGPVPAGTTLALGEGVSFAGVLDLTADGPTSGTMAALRALVPQPRLTVTAALAKGGTVELRGVLDGPVLLPTGSPGLSLHDAGVGIVVGGGNVTFKMFGELQLHLDDRSLDVQATLAISPEQITVAEDISFGEGGWRDPMGIRNLTLDELGFEMGITLLPAAGVTAGLAGTAHLGEAADDAAQFAFVFELVGEVPNPLLLSLYLERIDVKTALDLFAPDVDTAGLPAFVRELLVTDATFFSAESAVTLPDGTVAQPGLRIGGTVDVLGYQAHASLEIDPVAGIRGDLHLAPIHLDGVLSVTGHGQGIYLKQVDGRPVLERALPAEADDNAQLVEVVPPGGPVFALQSSRSPYLTTTAIATLLDVADAEIEAEVTDDAIAFKLVYEIADAAHAELDVSLTPTELHLSSQLDVHLKGDIGPIVVLGVDFGSIHLDAGCDADMQLDVAPSGAALRISGGFEFEGARLAFPTLELAAAPASLTRIPELLLDHVAEHASEIFEDLFGEAEQLLADATEAIAEAAEAAAQEIEQLGEDAVAEAGKIVADAEAAVDHAAEAVEDAAAAINDEAADIVKAAGAAVAELEQQAEEEVAEIGGEIGVVAEEAAREVEAIGTAIADEAQEVAHAVGQVAEEAAAAVEAIAEAVEQEVAQLLQQAGEVAGQLLAAAEQAAVAIEKEAEEVWNEVEQLAAAALKALEGAAETVADTAESVWNEVSKY